MCVSLFVVVVIYSDAMRCDGKVCELLRALVSEGVCSLSSLRAALRRAPTYLSEQLQAFLRGPDLKKSFKVAWAALAASASSDNRDSRKPNIT